MISIIVPMFNAENTIERCIRSIENQSYKDIEIIIINDGSKDKSLEICKKLKLEFENINIVDINNSGVSNARNLGIEAAKGEYIQFVDADDCVDVDYSKKMLECLQKENVDLVVSSYYESKLDVKKPIQYKECFFIYKDENFKRLLNTNRLLNSPCNKLFKKSKINKKFMKEISYGEDLIFCLEYIKECENCYFLNDFLYEYIHSENSLTTTYSEKKISDLINLDKICVQFGLKDEYYMNFIANLYDIFCIVSKCEKLENKTFFIKNVLFSRYIIDRMNMNMNNLDVKKYIFVLLVKYRIKFGIFLLSSLIRRKK